VTPAAWPRSEPLEDRLLVIDPAAGTWADGRIGDLEHRLGDALLVVNDAATQPASLRARGPRGEALELRLAGGPEEGEWRAVLFGEGDWRTRTEDRPPPPRLGQGDRVTVAPDLRAEITSVSPLSPRLVGLRFDAKPERLWSALYRAGRPVQYSYVERALPLWHVQTRYASRPWAVELPSAGRPLTWGLLLRLRARGVRLASLTHAAGLSSTGDAALDAALPLPEAYEIPAGTVAAIGETRASGGQVIAVGTTVVRALEGAAATGGGELRAGRGTTDLKIDGSFRPRMVDGLLSGLHEPGSSHFALCAAFAPAWLLESAFRHASDAGYLGHEFGDSSLILRDTLRKP
jgi:S-adenosylmethionine:tRNA ribosyltransferase-isomerase